MQLLLVYSLFLVFLIQVSNGYLLEGFIKGFTRHFEPDQPKEIVTREALPDTGYFNYLPALGLLGRVAHFLTTDTEGFGVEIKHIDAYLKAKSGAEKVLNTEREIVESFPVLTTIYELGKLLDRVGDVKDEITQKTLGDAIAIICNLSNDKRVRKEFIKRWHMLEYLDDVFKNPIGHPSHDRLQIARELLLEDPVAYNKLMSDPAVMNRVSSEVIVSLKDMEWFRTINIIEQIALLMKSYYPDQFEQIMTDISQVKDGDTSISLMDCMEVMSDIIKSPMFRGTMDAILRDESLRKMDEANEDTLQFLKDSGVITSVPQSAPEENEGISFDQLQPETAVELLKKVDVDVSEPTMAHILQEVHDKTLLTDFMQVLSETAATNKELTPQIIADAFREKRDIAISVDRIQLAMRFLQMFNAETIRDQLAAVGIDAKIEDIEKLQQIEFKFAPQPMSNEESKI